MEKVKNNRTKTLSDFLPKLVEASLNGDNRKVELVCLSLIRSCKDENPELAERLSGLISGRMSGTNGLRRSALESPPADAEGGLSLLKIENSFEISEPILCPAIEDMVTQVLTERQNSKRLLARGIRPTQTLLLKGKPGTGKTLLARWIAETLHLPLATLDLATSISSLLGRTGDNLRRSLNYARNNPCVLLLDEFDAIAKRRDDTSEVGELKRIVNVLLKELEDWPNHSLLIAATNHYELVDPAIDRRFDLKIELPLPESKERVQLLQRLILPTGEKVPKGILEGLSVLLEERSFADIELYVNAAIRRHLIAETPLVECLCSELMVHFNDLSHKRNSSALIKSVRASTNMTVRQLALLFGKSSTTIQHHLKK
ncbi:MAG: ATP-binding protein [Verrucomicrobiota bacterium]